MSTLKVTNIKAADGISALSIADSSGNVELKTTGANLILPSGGGISFQNHSTSTATDASSTTSDNVLDDYEKGSWTPVYEGSNGGSPSAGSVVEGFYEKIGNLVFIVGAIEGAKNTLSGNIAISGLPFTVNTLSTVYSGGLTIGRARLFATDMNLQLTLSTNSDEIFLWQNATNTSSIRATDSDLSNNTDWNEIYFSGCYISI